MVIMIVFIDIYIIFFVSLREGFMFDLGIL